MLSARVSRAWLCFLGLTMTALMALSPESWASSASMQAQQIPIGLLRDVSSAARFPASALYIDQGLYGDLEGSPSTQLGIFAWSRSRLGLAWSSQDDFLPGESLEAWWAIPLGGLDLGLAGGGWGRRLENSQETRDHWRTVETYHLNWNATMGLGLRLGSNGYLELAASAGQLRREQRQQDYLLHGTTWTYDSGYEIEPDCGASWRTAVRWSTAGEWLPAWLGHVAFMEQDSSTEGEWRRPGGERERVDLPGGSTTAEAMLGRRVLLGRDVALTAVLAASYTEDLETSRSSSGSGQASASWYNARFSGRLGLEATPRDWLRLYAGLGGGYRNSYEVRRELSGSGSWSRYSNEAGILDGLRASAGLGLHYRSAYLHTYITNDISTSNPFASASVGWSF